MKITVYNCARCAEDHENLKFSLLTIPINLEKDEYFTHFAICPILYEPILLRIIENNPPDEIGKALNV